MTTPDCPVAVTIDEQTLQCAPPYRVGPFRMTPTGMVPDGFVAVAALTCDPHPSGDVAADRTVGFSAHRWAGDVGGVIERLNRSSEHQISCPGSCDDDDSAVLDELWLVDNHGRAIRPGHPSDWCALPKPGALAAVKELTSVGSAEHRIALSDK
ncbi:hypothetical protein [Rhodococcus sp. 27YEA15]|uniref:hypothetical protein n=1 Tax=Rhodococcus sp. 27YEA15 TaxID=3156259 RepID=UPI003C7B9D06